MALFKIFKGSDSAKITNSAVSGYKTPVDGYAYYDTSTNLFYIDADYEGQGTITREPINANHANSATAATLALAAENDDAGNEIVNYYGHSLSVSGNTINLTNGVGANVGSGVTAIPYIIGTGSIAGTWLGSCNTITSYADGLLILYKPAVEGGATTTTLKINNLDTKIIYSNGTNKLNTQYPANQPILLVYSASQNDGCWICVDHYNSNTKIRVYRTSTNVELPLVGINSGDSIASYTTIASGSYDTTYGAIPDIVSNVATINPNSGRITAPGGVVANLTGNAETATRATQDAQGNVITTTYATLASPGFTGIPTAPTASSGTNTTQIATTAFVQATVSSAVPSSLGHTLTIGSYTFNGSADVSVPIYDGSISVIWTGGSY